MTLRVQGLKVIIKPRSPRLRTYQDLPLNARTLLRGSWVVTSGGISRVTIIITHISGLITPLITTHEPSSTATSRIGCSSAVLPQVCFTNQDEAKLPGFRVAFAFRPKPLPFRNPRQSSIVTLTLFGTPETLTMMIPVFSQTHI